MSGFSVFCLIVLAVIFVIMMSIMIIFERDKPKHIIVWTIIFLLTRTIGYIAYAIVRIIMFTKRNSLIVKQNEDAIYKSLVCKNLNNEQLDTDDELFKFNELAYDANLTVANNYEIISSYQKFKDTLIRDLKNASNYIFLELHKITVQDFDDVKNVLIEKAGKGVVIKLIYDSLISLKLKKSLKNAGIRIKRFSKHNAIGGNYSNLRNIISIDGNIAYFGRLDVTKNQLSGKIDVNNTFIKLKGDVVQDINLAIHQDIVFSTGKYIPYNEYKKDTVANKANVQFITNEYETDIELMIIKAICMAKKSIQLQLEKFIPTESIMSLLRFAINSNIDVKLMIPLKTGRHSKYYASRAYAKELALYGANVYLYDGYIRFNSITIDSEYVLYGAYVIDREFIGKSLQNIILIKDDKAVNYFNKEFENGINNSYRISNAKYMLLREKFFKNFV